VTPGARAEAAIQLLTAIGAGKGPADDLVADYFRRHRFAGAKDRAAISELIYGVLRFRASLDWWIAREGRGRGHDLELSPRSRVLAALLLIEEVGAAQISRDWDGDRFRPEKLGALERRFAEAVEGKKLADRAMPPAIAGNYPEWLEPALGASLGRDLAREMAALLEPAPLDLRVNSLKGEREAVRAALMREGVDAARTKLSPLGLRLFARVPLGQLDTFRAGQVEVQDEGSQLAALLADARPGMRVVDFCAGAGGKSLALAASMDNRGHLIACDISPRRLERATERVRRAGSSIVQRKPLASARDPWVKHHAASFDRVLVDAPCTGTGTWRRNPDAKWRLKPSDVVELTALQADILDSARRLVRPGGRLIYVTCSLLRAEDEEQVERFLAAHEDFALVPIARVWRETLGTPCPARAETLRLSPARHGTDGFFVAVMERRALATTPAAVDDAP
jgi:16S rRNA (cytosine967-C5)-methyltransferase